MGRLITSLPQLRATLQEAVKAGVAGFDTETTSVAYYNMEMVGFSYAYRKGKRIVSYYVPVRHNVGKNLIGYYPYLVEFLEHEDIIVAMHNGKFDIKVAHKHDIIPKCRIDDTMIMAHLVDENRRGVALKKLTKEEFNVEQTKFDELTQGRKIEDLNPEEVRDYAADDAKYTLMLYEKYVPLISEEELTQVYEKVELPLMHVLSAMARTGMPIDAELLHTMMAEARYQIGVNQAQVFEDMGQEINLNSTKQLGKVLFEDMNLPIIHRTAKGAYSVNADTLDILDTRGFEIAKKIKTYRWYKKMDSTFLKGLEPQFEGRIYPAFFQTGTVTGRLSSNSPNMQNTPLESNLGVRAVVIPFEGDDLVVADYSQIELRITAHLSEDSAMMKAFLDGADIHQSTADFLGITRKQAKTINFGVLYGLSAFHLAPTLGISKEEAQDIINGWFDAYPKVRDFKQYIEGFVTKYGYVRTISGRKRRLPGVYSDQWKERGYALRQALNSCVQGSGADLIKYSMIKIHEKYHQEFPVRLLSSVHDENIASVDSSRGEELRADIEKIMVECLELRVPIEVDTVLCKNWWWGKMHDDVKDGKIVVPPLLQHQIPDLLEDTVINNSEL